MKTIKQHTFIMGTLFLCTLFPSCENYFDSKYMENGNPRITDVRKSMTYTMTSDDVALIGKQCSHKGKDTVPSMYEQKALSLCTAGDSTAYLEWKKIASLKAFTEQASADIYVPMFMAQKFPYLDAGTMCNVTYPLYEGKSERVAPFKYSSPYTLTEDDYRAIWSGRGVSYLTPLSEARIPDFLASKFPLAAEGKIIILTYDFHASEPDSIIPFLPYDCTVGQLLEAEEKQEHRLTGIIGTVKSTIYGRFFLVDGKDSIYVYGLTDEGGNRVWKDKNLQKGDRITIKGNYSKEFGEPQFINAVYVSHEKPNGAPLRKALKTVKNAPKSVIYQLKGGKWSLYQNGQLTVAQALQPSDYADMRIEVVADAEKTIGPWLKKTFSYPREKDIYLIAYKTASGTTADEWTYNGTDFVMNTGYVTEVMSFVRTNEWKANVTTYYTTPFVNSGQADFTLHNVALDGLSYVWLYKAAYGMTATGYVSGTNHPIEGWLVSPKIRMKKSKQPELTFYHAIRYGVAANNADWLKVKVTDNFTGDVTTTHWTHLTFKDSIPDGSNWTFLNAGRFDLSQFNGQTIVVAFEYNTTIGDVKSSPTWEIQDLLVAEKEDVDQFIRDGNAKRNIK